MLKRESKIETQGNRDRVQLFARIIKKNHRVINRIILKKETSARNYYSKFKLPCVTKIDHSSRGDDTTEGRSSGSFKPWL